MITLITGLPGAGKTLYVVAELLFKQIGASVKYEDDNGDTITAPRTFYTNINGFLFDHVKIDATWLETWHDQAPPGAIIIYDEVQKSWPLKATGSAVPKCIEMLETHRHLGVDFILLTQHPMLIHTNITRLAGRHLHVRRLGPMGVAGIYEWDGVSKSLLYKNTISKSIWRFKSWAFKYYKSAKVHTKQPRKVPTVLFGILFAVALLAYLGPSVYNRLAERLGWAPKTVPALSHVPGSSLVSPIGTPLPAGPVAPLAPAPASVLASAAPAAVFAGCARLRARCQCFDTAGVPVEKEPMFCADSTRVATGHGDVLKNIRGDGGLWNEEIRRAAYDQNDGTVLAYMRGRSEKISLLK